MRTNHCFPDGASLLTRLKNPPFYVVQSGSWSTLRATEGWAALQHHAVLKTTITLHPPSLGSPISFPSTFSVQAPVPNLLFTLSQGSFFTVVPQPSASTSTPENQTSSVPEWYAGNIYDMQRGTPQTVTLPVPPSLDRPTVYDVFVSGDYEVCLIDLCFVLHNTV